MTIFRCDLAFGVVLVGAFFVAWNGVLLWFLRKGFIAIGGKEGSSSGGTTTYRSKDPVGFWLRWIGMFGFGNFVLIKALMLLFSSCSNQAMG